MIGKLSMSDIHCTYKCTCYIASTNICGITSVQIIHCVQTWRIRNNNTHVFTFEEKQPFILYNTKKNNCTLNDIMCNEFNTH